MFVCCELCVGESFLMLLYSVRSSHDDDDIAVRLPNLFSSQDHHPCSFHTHSLPFREGSTVNGEGKE